MQIQKCGFVDEFIFKIFKSNPSAILRLAYKNVSSGPYNCKDLLSKLNTFLNNTCLTLFKHYKLLTIKR